MSTYIFIEGLLSETGTFKVFRAFETQKAHIPTTTNVEEDNFTLRLTDDQDVELFVEKLPVVFNYGCHEGSKVISSAAIRSAIPLVKGATKLTAYYQGKEVYSARIGRSSPKLSGLKVKVSKNLATINYESDAQALEIRVFARLEDKRLLRPTLKQDNKHIIVDLNSLSGQGEVTLVVEGTKALRTTRIESGSISTPPSNVKGLIIEPADKSQWPYKKRGSLIASVFDENGRQLNWDQSGLVWKINNELLKGGKQVEAWAPDQEGKYQITLVKKHQNGREEILSESNVEVLPPT